CERNRLQSNPAAPRSDVPATAAGIACGAGAALFWAAGFVAARHGIAAGFSPADLAFHRFVWAGLAFLPFVARAGLRDLGGGGWAKGVALTLVGGPPLAFLSYAGFLFVPLAHGGVIQPSCAALGGLVLATLVLKEKLPTQRAIGALVIVAGLAVIGADALATIGTRGLVLRHRRIDVREFRDAAAALAHRADARGRGHQRRVAHRCADPVARLRLRAHDRIGADGKSRAARCARHLRRRRWDLSFHPRGRAARRRPRRGFPVAGAGIH